MQNSARSICTCALCTNFSFLVRKFAANPQYFSEESNLPHTFSPYGLSRASVCPHPDSQPFSSRQCYNGECSHCSPSLLNLELKPQYKELGIKYRQFSRVQKEGLDRKIVDLVEVISTAQEALDQLLVQLKVYIEHDFCYRWQRGMYRQCIEDLLPFELVSTADFAENITFEYDEEIQSMHWSKSQCSLFVEVCDFLLPSSGAAAGDTEYTRVTETHAVWSDDRCHDVAFAEAAHAKIFDNLRGRPGLPEFKFWNRWTDNCACQFKCADSFLAVSNSVRSIGIPVQHNFFERNHGKSMCDSEGGASKSAVKRELLRPDGDLPREAASVVEWCNANMSEPRRSREGKEHRIHRRYVRTCSAIQACHGWMC
jgi:hypothetical protein